MTAALGYAGGVEGVLARELEEKLAVFGPTVAGLVCDLRLQPFSRMSCTRKAPSDITSPDGVRQVNVFGCGSPLPKAMVAPNSQLAPFGY